MTTSRSDSPQDALAEALDAEKKAAEPQMGVMLVTVNGIDYVPIATAQKEREQANRLRADLAVARGALRQIKDDVLLQYREGEMPFQYAILATSALDETQER